MDKSVVVKVTYRKSHHRYETQYTKQKKFMAHDEDGMAKEGDIVRFIACRPLSKRKHFSLTHVLRPLIGGEPFEVTPLPPFVRGKEKNVKVLHKKGRGQAPDQITGKLAWMSRWKEREALRAKAVEMGTPVDKVNERAWLRS
jgi:small subunit ribosomal protein S17